MNFEMLSVIARLMDDGQYQVSMKEDFVGEQKSMINALFQQTLRNSSSSTGFDVMANQVCTNFRRNIRVVHFNLQNKTVQMSGAQVGANYSFIPHGKLKQMLGLQQSVSKVLQEAVPSPAIQFKAEAVSEQAAVQAQQVMTQVTQEVDEAIESAKAQILNQQEEKELPVERQQEQQRGQSQSTHSKSSSSDKVIDLPILDKGRRSKEAREEQRSSAERAAKDRKMFQEQTEALDEKSSRIKTELHKHDRTQNTEK